MSAANELAKARKAYVAGKQQRKDWQRGNDLARASGGTSAQGGGAR
jgi:hypothetical protein